MTSAIISAINILTKPLGELMGCNAQSSRKEAILALLQNNRSSLLEELQRGSTFEQVRRLREEVMSEADWFDSATQDITWSFVQECLLLLLTLERHLNVELEHFKETPALAAAGKQASETIPPLPPDALSVTQQKTLRAILQFVVSLGLCPYLNHGVGVPLPCRSAFGALVDNLVCHRVLPESERCLFTTTHVLLQFAKLSSLATLVFTEHLNDVMAALCQLGYQPQDAKRSYTEEKTLGLSAEERQSCREELKSLLEKVYQPIVIKELLILQGGPKQSDAERSPCGSKSKAAMRSAPAWLRRLCGQLLSDRLIQPNGVQAVLSAILEEGTGESDWRKCDSVARILVTCPQQFASADSYYRRICPQIIDLLHFRDKLTSQQFQHVATRAVLFMSKERPSLAQQYLLAPLLAPLQQCITASSGGHSQVAVDEWELRRCVEDMHKIWVVGNSPSASLLKALQQVCPVVFTLFCFTKQNVSHLRGPCQDILLWYLSHTKMCEALSVLRLLSGLEEQKNKVIADLLFRPGSEGGAILCIRESYSNEDDALYEKLSEEQWRLECLMQLLAELKDNDLPGAFFLDLLQELTCWASDENEEKEDEMKVSTMTLLEVEEQQRVRTAQQEKRLALLQVLAMMVECLHHTVLLRKCTQVVGFLASLFQRASVGLVQTNGSGLGNLVESQTLSMGMGLVATLLSEPQLNAGDYSSLSRLLPPLETISQMHPDVFIQELASSLRGVIATHGAFGSEHLSTAAQSATNTAFRTKQKGHTKVTNPQTSPHLSTSNSNPPPTIQIIHPSSSGSSAVQLGLEGRTSGTSDSCPPTTAISELLLNACDPDVPTRAAALRSLTRMVQNREPEAVQAEEKILMLFLENLEDEDTFIYLSAIQGLVVLVDSFPERILKRLLQDFHPGGSLPTSNKDHSLETRLKVGEVLMRASRAIGDLAPHFGQPLIGIFLRGTKDPDQSIRASSLSNLGELCQRMHYSLGPLAQELSSCLTAVIKTEKEAEVRRAAVHVITLLLRGLSNKTTQVLRDVLLDLYRALKWVVRLDPDSIARLHAQVALEELDDIMRAFIFPEQKLEKKIVVLP